MTNLINKSIEIHNFKNSSNILRIDYDHLMNNLYIYFRTGAIYQYINVPESLFIDFKKAGSAGNYFKTYIRDNYEHLRKS